MKSKKLAIGLAVALVSIVASATIAGADKIEDFDASNSPIITPPGINYQDTANTANYACSSRGSAVGGAATLIAHNGGEKFSADDVLVVSGRAWLTSDGTQATVSGVTVSGSNVSVPNPWTAGTSTKEFAFSTTVASSIPNGSYTVELKLTKQNSTPQVSRNFELNVNCTPQADSWELTFHRPMVPSDASGSVTNEIKNGRVVPVKVEIVKNGVEQTGTDGELSTSFNVRTTGVPCTSGDTAAAPSSEYADAGESSAGTKYFRWSDEVPGFWVYNLDTKALGLTTGKCYRIDVYSGATKISADDWVVVKAVK